jgi:hypothetical protein
MVNLYRRDSMFTDHQIIRMRSASRLLPEPGGEIVRQCLDEIDRLRSVIADLKKESNAQDQRAGEVKP